MFDHTNHMIAIGPVHKQFDLLKAASNMFNKLINSGKMSHKQKEEEQNGGFTNEFYEDLKLKSTGLMEKEFSIFIKIGISIILLGLIIILVLRNKYIISKLEDCFKKICWRK